MLLSISHDMSITKREIVDWRNLEYLRTSGNWGIGAIAFGLGAVVLGLDRLRVARGRPERAIGGVLMLCVAFVVVDALIWIAIGGA